MSRCDPSPLFAEPTEPDAYRRRRGAGASGCPRFAVAGGSLCSAWTGSACWTDWTFRRPTPVRVASLRRLLDSLDFEIDVFAGLARGRLARLPAI